MDLRKIIGIGLISLGALGMIGGSKLSEYESRTASKLFSDESYQILTKMNQLEESIYTLEWMLNNTVFFEKNEEEARINLEVLRNAYEDAIKNDTRVVEAAYQYKSLKGKKIIRDWGYKAAIGSLCVFGAGLAALPTTKNEDARE